MHKKTRDIRDFILHLCRNKSREVATETAKRFGISKQAATRHIKILETNGVIASSGNGKAKTIQLCDLVNKVWTFPLLDLREDVVWSEKLAPLLSDLPSNVYDIWHYGVTEMINNAIDHSEGKQLILNFIRTAIDTEILIQDDGEGVFYRIQRLAHLYDPREAILELAKGKFTTDPSNHSGEGIFFTSRVFDLFLIHSGNLFFSHSIEDKDWLIDCEKEAAGTTVVLRLNNNSSRILNEVYDYFAEADEYAFNKTVVPVKLARYEGEKLVSRSQAKRLVARFEKFKTVILDFTDVETIGQAFADEIFRVFTSRHPEINLMTIHETDQVKLMILRALAAKNNT